MKLYNVWFRTFLNIQDTRLNLQFLFSDKRHSMYLESGLELILLGIRL